MPDSIKSAIVTPLIKKPTLDKEDLKNYRPVSNLPFVSKVIERVVDNQLRSHMSENDLFECMQSAYRANHSTETALVRVLNDILLAVDKKQMVGLVLLDLSAAFDTINHSVLLQRLRDRIGLDGTALKWFKSYLTNRSQKVSVKGSLSSSFRLETGVPQGSVLGPLLFTIYMSPLADLIRKHGIEVHFFADDTQIYICFSQSEVTTSIANLEMCIRAVRQWMAQNFLKLNDDKTEFLLLTSKHLNGSIAFPSSIRVGDLDVAAVSMARNIGAMFDTHVSLDQHVRSISKSCYFQLHNISQIRKFLTPGATALLVNALVTSKLDGLNALLVGLPQQTIMSLQRVQNHAARVVTGVARYDHITPVLHDLHWLPVHYRIQFKILLLTFKCVLGIAPSYLSDLINMYKPSRSLRSQDQLLLQQPRARLASYGDRAFAIVAPSLWNQVPYDIRASSSVTIFKKRLKTYLFSKVLRQ